MKIFEKAKDLGKKTIDVSKKAGRKGIEVSRKGVEKTKQVIRKKVCPDCKYYAPIDENQGDCPIGGRRLATSDILTCPQKAFTPNEGEEEGSVEYTATGENYAYGGSAGQENIESETAEKSGVTNRAYGHQDAGCVTSDTDAQIDSDSCKIKSKPLPPPPPSVQTLQQDAETKQSRPHTDNETNS